MKGKKIKAILLIAVFILSTLAIAIPVSAADGIQITLPTLETKGVGASAVWDDTKSLTGDWSAKLGLPATVDGEFYGAIVFETDMKFSDIDIVKLNYFFEESTTSAGGPHIYIHMTSDTSSVCVTFFSPVAGTTKYEVGEWTEMVFDADVDPANSGFFYWESGEANALVQAATEAYVQALPGWTDETWTGGSGIYGGPATLPALSFWQDLIGDYDVDYIQVEYGWWTGVLPGGDVWIDDVSINGVTYPVELKQGPVGTKTTVEGYGATPGGLVKVYWDAIPAGYLGETHAKAISPYTYSIKITIPEDEEGAHGIIVKDIETNKWTTTPYTVTPKIVLSPKAGIKGDPITVTGTGFTGSTATSPIEVTMSLAGVVCEVEGTTDTSIFTLSWNEVTDATLTTLNVYVNNVLQDPTPSTGDYTYDETDKTITFDEPPLSVDVITADYEFTPVLLATSPATLKTSSLGSFTGTFTIPLKIGDDLIVDNTYAIEATDGAKTATATLTVGTCITLTPKKGLMGTTVTVVGRGFTPKDIIDVRWGDFLTLIEDYTIGSTGAFTKTFTVPPVDPNKYDVTAVDSDTGTIIAEAEFTVTGVSKITLDEKTGLEGDKFIVTGEHFTPLSKVTVYFDAKVLVTGVSVGSDGGFVTVELVVPDGVAYGAHTIKAMDSKGVFATTTFTVVAKVTTIETRSVSYDPGDTISFDIYSTVEFKKTSGLYEDPDIPYDDIIIEIDDPDGYLFWDLAWAPVEIDTATWGVLYSAQVDAGQHLTLPSDAKPGIWTWTAEYYLKAASATKLTATGTFTVGEPVGPQPELPAETTDQEAKDPNGVTKTSFVLGDMVMASAKITNTGTQSQQILVQVQWKDPLLHTLAPTFFITTLEVGQSFTYMPGVILPLTGLTGTWTAKVNIYDTWVAQGGVAKGTPVTITITVS